MAETRVREALVAQALEDLDGLIARLESLEARLGDLLGAKIESVSKTALNAALLDAEMRLRQITKSQTADMMTEGQNICREIRAELMKPHIKAIANSLDGRVQSFLALAVSIGILAGGTGGLLIAWFLR